MNPLPIVAVAGAYVVGSIPWAYLAGRVVRGVDLRTYGSGNLGTTNVLRLLGVPAAIGVYALDASKGMLPVLLFPRLFQFDRGSLWTILCGLAAILGHVRPVFLLWRGAGRVSPRRRESSSACHPWPRRSRSRAS